MFLVDQLLHLIAPLSAIATVDVKIYTTLITCVCDCLEELYTRNRGLVFKGFKEGACLGFLEYTCPDRNITHKGFRIVNPGVFASLKDYSRVFLIAMVPLKQEVEGNFIQSSNLVELVYILLVESRVAL